MFFYEVESKLSTCDVSFSECPIANGHEHQEVNEQNQDRHGYGNTWNEHISSIKLCQIRMGK